MQKCFEVQIIDRIEKLPILKIGDNFSIAFFNLHGNVELTEHCAIHIAPLVLQSKADIILTAESKGLQLVHAIAKNLSHKFYAVARKSQKLYLQDGISVSYQSITTKGEQTLYLSKHDVDLLKGKKVAIIDDVISTGESVSALEKLAETAGGKVVLKATVLAEGDAKNRTDIKFLADIPLFFDCNDKVFRKIN
ncbi:MAG: adenine phosphoribosyltransferase [Firmicutes bacterium]|nr:adenine phosphoribosyltransferase [Bacillota bacterium]